MIYKNDFGLQQFNEEGYTVINNAFPREDLAAFKKVFLNIIANTLELATKKYPELKDATVGIDGDEGLLALRYTAPDYVPRIQRLISRSPEFFKLSSTEKIFNIIRQCMGVNEHSPLYLMSNGIVFTNPNDSKNRRSTNFELEWHQDTFLTIPKSSFIQFWGPVIHDSTKELGTLCVCPGSHKDGYGKQLIHTDQPYNHRYSMASGEENKYEQVPVELALGQLLIFHGQMIHASGHNVSEGKMRISTLGICHDASREECEPVSTYYKYHHQTPEQWFYDVYQDEKAKNIMFDQLAENGEPVGGI